MTWDEAVAYALTLPGTTLSTSYGQPAVKANGRTVLNVGHERETSFCLQLDCDLKQMLMETRPDSFFETPHYAGYSGVLVRHGGPDEALVRDMIGRAVEIAAAKRPSREKVRGPSPPKRRGA